MFHYFAHFVIIENFCHVKFWYFRILIIYRAIIFLSGVLEQRSGASESWSLRYPRAVAVQTQRTLWFIITIMTLDQVVWVFFSFFKWLIIIVIVITILLLITIFFKTPENEAKRRDGGGVGVGGGLHFGFPRGYKQQPAVGPQSNLMKRITFKTLPRGDIKTRMARARAVYPVIYL